MGVLGSSCEVASPKRDAVRQRGAGAHTLGSNFAGDEEGDGHRTNSKDDPKVRNSTEKTKIISRVLYSNSVDILFQRDCNR